MAQAALNPFKVDREDIHDTEENVSAEIMIVEDEESTLTGKGQELTIELTVDHVIIEYDKGKDLDETQIQCEQCEQIMHKKSLSRHKLRKHQSTKLSCQHCKVSVSTLFKLEDHMRKMHQNEVLVADCDYCDKKFKNRDVLQYHMKTSHSNIGKEQLNKCQECGKTYSTKDNLSRHRRKQHTIVNN